MIERNQYLKDREFSVSCKLQGTDGKYYNTRVFTEDGIYEVTLLSDSKKGKIFRAWVKNYQKTLDILSYIIYNNYELQKER